MAITSITRDWGIIPSIVRITATNTVAEVSVANYITAQIPNTTAVNNGLWEWLPSDTVLVYCTDNSAFFTISADFSTLDPLVLGSTSVTLPVVSGDFANFSGTSGLIHDAGFLPSDASKTVVVMANGAVLTNHIATFKDVTGTIGEDAATAINGGNIQAGLSGTAGTLASFPATGAKGSLKVVAVANTGDTTTTISNAAMGQASVVSIPDPGTATATFVVAPAATIANHIATFTTTTGVVGDDAATAINGGNIQAGLSGTAGTVASFPATGAKGSLKLTAVANTGDTITTISNAAMGQASVVSIPDPGAATAKFVLDSGSQQMATASNLKLDKGTGTESANAVTISKQSGVITSAALTTAAGSTEVITLTNTLIATTSVVLVSVGGGTNTTIGVEVKATAASGSSVITISNNNAASALNGTVIIMFAVF